MIFLFSLLLSFSPCDLPCYCSLDLLAHNIFRLGPSALFQYLYLHYSTAQAWLMHFLTISLHALSHKCLSFHIISYFISVIFSFVRIVVCSYLAFIHALRFLSHTICLSHVFVYLMFSLRPTVFRPW